MQIKLNSFRITSMLLWGVAIMVVGHLLSMTVRFAFHHDVAWGLVPFLNLDEEYNLPSFFSFALLTVAAILFFIIGLEKREKHDLYTRYWYGLSLVFSLVAIDELLQLHERIDGPLRETLNSSGLLFYAWVIPYGFATVCLGLVYLRFFISLPPRTRVGIILSGVVFFAGALGIELLEGFMAQTDSSKGLLFTTLAGIEETCEMLGVVILIHTLFKYIEHYGISLRAEFIPAMAKNANLSDENTRWSAHEIVRSSGNFRRKSGTPRATIH